MRLWSLLLALGVAFVLAGGCSSTQEPAVDLTKQSQTQLDQLGQKIVSMKTEAAKAAGVVKLEAEAKILLLEQLRDNIQAKLTAAKAKTGEEMDKAQAEVSSLLEQLKKQVDELGAKLTPPASGG